MPATLPKRADVERPAFQLPDEDLYEARFLDYGDVTKSMFIDKRTGEARDQIRLVFEIKDESEFDGVEVSGFFDYEMNALNKRSIYHVVTALDPDNEADGGESLDDYLNKKGRIEVKHTKPRPNPNGGPPLVYANVASVKPLRKRRAVAEESTNGNAKKSVFADEDENGK